MKSEKHRQKACVGDDISVATRRTVAETIEGSASGLAFGPLQALLRKARPYSFCELCKVALNSESAMDIHNKGKKHMQKLKNEGYRRLIMLGNEREAEAKASSAGPGSVEGASSSSTGPWDPSEVPSSSTSLSPPQGAESTSSPVWIPPVVTSSSSIKKTKAPPSSTPLKPPQGAESASSPVWIPPVVTSSSSIMKTKAPPSSTPLNPPQGAESASSPAWNPPVVTSSSSIKKTKSGPESTPPPVWMPSKRQQDMDTPMQHRGIDLSCGPCGIVLFKSLEYKLEHISTTAHQHKESEVAGRQRPSSDAPRSRMGLTISEFQRLQGPGISRRGWSRTDDEKDEE
ncbi:hypothetical protein V5799_012952 [Amblyomma americanum]|uniref:C2H2-type domain-containing protein n=1 Tax=Amblyomma americanum TaxID=6943 RepID=A0AAQ4E7D7_AMBAM